MSDDLSLEGEQTILEHLNEFRVRLTWAVGGLVVATVISFAFTEPLLEFLIEPYGEQLQTLSPTEGIETYFKVALMSGSRPDSTKMAASPSPSVAIFTQPTATVVAAA